MVDRKEVEFAACLLECGGPEYLRPAGTTYQRGKGVLMTRDEHITSADYMFKCCDLYDKHVEPPPTTIGERSLFPLWWEKYKEWLVENRRG